MPLKKGGYQVELPADLKAQAEAIAEHYLRDMKPTHVGRLSELADVDTVDVLLRGAALGLNNTDCARAARISPETLRTWIQRGSAEPDSPFGTFLEVMQQARSYGKLQALEQIAAAGQLPQFWTANAWRLERTDPEQFAKRQDDANTPKVIVQIGARDSDVTVNVPSLQPQPTAVEVLDVSPPELPPAPDPVAAPVTRATAKRLPSSARRRRRAPLSEATS